MINRASRSSLSFSLLILICALSLIGCRDTTTSTHDDLSFSFGLPGKGDQNCQSESALCWGGADADHARTLMNIETEVLLGDRAPVSLVAAIKRLEHKLNGEELAALDLLTAKLHTVDQSNEALEDRALAIREGFESVYGRVISSYWGAHATLLSDALKHNEVALLDDKADRLSTPLPEALPTTEALKPALETLWAQGPFGQYLVTMITLTGMHRYEPKARSINEREAGKDVAVDREAAKIVSHHSRLAAVDGLVTGMASLIPVAGLFISVPYGIYAQFKVRAHMSLELGTLYGLDPKDPDDFLVIIQSMLASQGFKELFSSIYKSLVGTQGYRMIAGREGNQLLVGSDRFSKRRVDELMKLSLGQLAIYGVRIFEVIQARVTGKAAKNLLGSMTFGVLTLAEVTLDYLSMQSAGRELRYALHPWGWVTYLEAMPQLADQEYRRCAHSALIELAQADGDVTGCSAYKSAQCCFGHR